MIKKARIIQKAMQEIEKMLLEMEREGKDLSLIKLKKYQKTHHISCKCAKCEKANKKNVLSREVIRSSLPLLAHFRLYPSTTSWGDVLFRQALLITAVRCLFSPGSRET